VKVKCTINPVTARLKQLVKEYGDDWWLIEPLCKVQCFDNEVGALVESKDGGHSRWVRYPDEIRF